jgi:hypothetical protein
MTSVPDQKVQPKMYVGMYTVSTVMLEPILRLLNLQLQSQRFSRLEHFCKVEGNIFFQNALGYSWVL